MLRLPASLTCMAKPSFGRLIRTWRTRSRRSRKEGYSSRADFALKSPYWQKMLQLVAQYDPSFDAVEYNARARARTDATSGKLAQNNNALNTGIGHVWQLAQAVDALHNGNWQSFNALKNWWSEEFGGTAPTNFEAIRDRVAPEITKVWRGAGGAESDIKRDIATLSDARESCAALWRSRGNRRPYGIEDRSQRSAVRKYHGADGRQAPK